MPDEADYGMLLERRGIDLAHARLVEDRPLAAEEIILYLAHSRKTEQRAAEQVAQMLACMGDDPELGRGLAIVADDEVNHLSYCHEELLRFSGAGHAVLIRDTLKRYAMTEIRVNREVSLVFARRVASILGWPRWKRALVVFGAEATYVVERSWLWRRMTRLAPPVRTGALDGASSPSAAGAA